MISFSLFKSDYSLKYEMVQSALSLFTLYFTYYRFLQDLIPTSKLSGRQLIYLLPKLNAAKTG